MNRDKWGSVGCSYIDCSDYSERKEGQVDSLGVRVLEVKIVLAILEELGRSNVKSNLDLSFVAGVGNGSD